ncbi:MAG: hypothetical protein AAGI12_10485 [Pseudomonadota bacterium]
MSNEWDETVKDHLEAVERAARGLAAFFERDDTGKKDNQHLPPDFPSDQLTDIASALMRVSRALPMELQPPLEQAQRRLGAIRADHIPMRGEKPYGRGTYIDELIQRLMTEISTALELLTRGQDLSPKLPHEPDATLNEDERLAADQLMELATAISDKLGIAISEAEGLIGQLDQNQLDVLIATLVTSDVVERVITAELRHDPRVSWLESLTPSREKLPELLEDAADGVDGLADVGATVWKLIKDPGTGIVNGMRNGAEALRELAVRMREAQEADGRQGAFPPPFDLDEIKENLIKGIAPHPAHVPRIEELNFNDEKRLVDLSALSGLTGLLALGLDGTGVRDLSALSGLTGLQELFLSGTGVSDVNLKALQPLIDAGLKVRR